MNYNIVIQPEILSSDESIPWTPFRSRCWSEVASIRGLIWPESGIDYSADIEESFYQVDPNQARTLNGQQKEFFRHTPSFATINNEHRWYPANTFRTKSRANMKYLQQHSLRSEMNTSRSSACLREGANGPLPSVNQPHQNPSPSPLLSSTPQPPPPAPISSQDIMRCVARA
jgi:hypothetical protein